MSVIPGENIKSFLTTVQGCLPGLVGAYWIFLKANFPVKLHHDELNIKIINVDSNFTVKLFVTVKSLILEKAPDSHTDGGLPVGGVLLGLEDVTTNKVLHSTGFTL